MLEDDHDMSSFVEANKDWSVLVHGYRVARVMELSSAILRAQHMIGHWIWWTFLKDEVPQHVKARLQPSIAPISKSSWVSQLVRYIHKSYSLPRSKEVMVVEFGDVFPNSASDSQLFKPAKLGRMGIVLEEEKEDTLIAHTCQVIVQWLDMPCAHSDSGRNLPSNAWDTQGWFVDSILSLQHPGLLLLKDLYKVFSYRRLPSLTQPEALRIQRSLVNTFVTDVDNGEQTVQLDKILASFLPSVSFSTPGHEWNPSIVFPSELEGSAPSASGSEPGVDKGPGDIQDAGNAIVQFLLDIEPIYASSPSHPFQSLVSDVEWVSPNYLLHYYTRSVLINIQKKDKGKRAGYTQSQIACHWVSLDLNHHSPFREDASSRSKFVLGVKDQPVFSRSWFFSLLVFRGITFCTGFLNEDGNAFFRDPTHFVAVTEEPRYVGKPKKFFCSQTAYGGNAISARSIDNVHTFWEAAGKWMEHLAKNQTRPLPFASACSFMKLNNRLMWSMGPLLQLLTLGMSCLV